MSETKAANKPKYTPDELSALPQTQQVFDRPVMSFDAHEWRQEGYMLTDVCSPARMDCHHVGIPIPEGKVLMKINGRYDLIDEEASRELRRRSE